MKVTATALPEVLLIEPDVFVDARGFFMESFNARRFREATGVEAIFVQDNQSHSERNVLRGIHYQVVRPQGKLVRCASGAIFDVAVDLRRSSPDFGRWVGVTLSAENRRQLWVPPGFGHAFLARTEADVLYKTTEYWIGEHDRSLLWSDRDLAIDWFLEGRAPLLAEKDREAPALARAEVFA